VSGYGGGCWPTPAEQSILEACFAKDERARTALERLPSLDKLREVDPAAQQLLPLLCRRWSASELPAEIAEYGPRLHLALWRQNRLRLAGAQAIARGLQARSIETLWLKGAALLTGVYKDAGLRGMADVDFLVREQDAERAIEFLLADGWLAEDGFSTADILRLRRVLHGWQFERGAGDEKETCDLHWRPVVRCYSPQVTEMFWNGAREVVGLRIPCATDQVFHVCAHGFEWSGSSKIRWIPDALMLLRSGQPMDGERLCALARSSSMTLRLSMMLRYLQEHFDVEVPLNVLQSLGTSKARRWETREAAILQKKLPLGFADSIGWHVIHYHRLRPFDGKWSHRAFLPGFTEYLKLFLRVRGAGALFSALWREIRIRVRA
jgi:hypothetical protein